MNETTPTPERRNSRRRKTFRASVRAYLRLGSLDIGAGLGRFPSLICRRAKRPALLVKPRLHRSRQRGVRVGLELGQAAPATPPSDRQRRLV